MEFNWHQASYWICILDKGMDSENDSAAVLSDDQKKKGSSNISPLAAVCEITFERIKAYLFNNWQSSPQHWLEPGLEQAMSPCVHYLTLLAIAHADTHLCGLFCHLYQIISGKII